LWRRRRRLRRRSWRYLYRLRLDLTVVILTLQLRIGIDGHRDISSYAHYPVRLRRSFCVNYFSTRSCDPTLSPDVFDGLDRFGAHSPILIWLIPDHLDHRITTDRRSSRRCSKGCFILTGPHNFGFGALLKSGAVLALYDAMGWRCYWCALMEGHVEIARFI
jgi:hypothetical protein